MGGMESMPNEGGNAQDQGGTEGNGGQEGGQEGGQDGGQDGGSTWGVGGTDGNNPNTSTSRIDLQSELPTPAQTTLEPPAEIQTPATASPDSTCAGQWVEEVRGWIVDETGNPLQGGKAQVCVHVSPANELLCLMPSDSDETGYFSIIVPEDARCMIDVALRSIVPLEEFAAMYCQMDFAQVGEDAVLRMTEPLVLYETRPALSRQEVTSEDEPHTVTLLGDLSLTVIPNTLYKVSYDKLLGRPVPVDGPGLCFLKDQPPVDGLFAFYPEGDIVDSSAGLRFPNTAGYEPMSEVELYVLGNLDCSVEGQEEGIDEAKWHAFGRGVVDASGMWVEKTSEGGLPCISWLGYGPVVP